MVNIRKKPAGEEVIWISGKSILRKEIRAFAKLSGSWYAFLEEQGIKLTPQDEVYVKAIGTTGPPLTAELSEPIGDLIRKYARRRLMYNVQLVAKQVGWTTSRGRSGASPARLLRTPSIAAGPQIVVPVSGGGQIASSGGTGLYRKPRYTPKTVKSSGKYGTRLKTLITTGQQNGTEALAGPSSVKVEMPSSQGEDDNAESFIAPVIINIKSLTGRDPPPELEIEEHEEEASSLS